MNDVVACDNLGSFISLNGRTTANTNACCHVRDQNSSVCKRLFAPTTGLLDSACLASPEECNLFTRCRLPETLYTSAEQNNEQGNGSLLLARYNACANLPAIASLSNQGSLVSYIDDVVRPHLQLAPRAADADFPDSLQQITSSVTDCLSSTCRHGREDNGCYNNFCSPVKMISNNTLPNVVGINDCLFSLCNAGTGALPWADADIVGIGVFTSYVTQCALVVILWAGLALFSLHHVRRGWPDRPSKAANVSSHFASWIDLVLECHKAQCYFCGALMIAVTVQNIYEVDLVTTFLVLPLVTNSILPVIFTYFLLVYYQASSVAITILTAVIYLLSSVIYWALYSHLPLPPGMTRVDMYKRYRLNISSIRACGEYSGLAVCPVVHPNSDEYTEGLAARTSLRVLTPMIWTWSTFAFFVLLARPVYTWIRTRRWKEPRLQPAEGSLRLRWQRAVFWFTTLVFLAGVGMQVSVLTTAIKLDMVDVHGWSFGQVVAVTVWVPPLLEYICGEINDILSKNTRRKKTFKQEDQTQQNYLAIDQDGNP